MTDQLHFGANVHSRIRTDFLYQSPSGVALTGACFNLINHLLAVDHSWYHDANTKEARIDFSQIRFTLATFWPGYHISEEVLAEVAGQYINQDLVLMHAWKSISPDMLPPQAPPYQTFDALSGRTLSPHTYGYLTLEAPDLPPLAQETQFANVSPTKSGISAPAHAAEALSPPNTPSLVSLPVTPSAPRAPRVRLDLPVTPDSPSPLPLAHLSTNVPAKIAVVGKQHTTKNVRRFIPEDQADAFVAGFQHGRDKIPELITGYYWYCDKGCYSGKESENNGRVRGRFHDKRSANRHYQNIHNMPDWRVTTLPEKRRDIRLPVAACNNVILDGHTFAMVHVNVPPLRDASTRTQEERASELKPQQPLSSQATGTSLNNHESATSSEEHSDTETQDVTTSHKRRTKQPSDGETSKRSRTHPSFDTDSRECRSDGDYATTNAMDNANVNVTETSAASSPPDSSVGRPVRARKPSLKARESSSVAVTPAKSSPFTEDLSTPATSPSISTLSQDKRARFANQPDKVVATLSPSHKEQTAASSWGPEYEIQRRKEVEREDKKEKEAKAREEARANPRRSGRRKASADGTVEAAGKGAEDDGK